MASGEVKSVFFKDVVSDRLNAVHQMVPHCKTYQQRKLELTGYCILKRRHKLRWVKEVAVDLIGVERRNLLIMKKYIV